MHKNPEAAIQNRRLRFAPSRRREDQRNLLSCGTAASGGTGRGDGLQAENKRLRKKITEVLAERPLGFVDRVITIVDVEQK